MDALVKTELPKKNYGDGLVPAIADGALVTDSSGKFSASQTLPDKVQNNIAVEKISFSDKTTNNSSTGKHGLLTKLSGESDEFLNGAGEFVRPPKSGSGFGNIWWVKSGQTVTVGETYENVVTNMLVDGTLIVDGILTIL